MRETIRRSWLLVPMSQAAHLAQAPQSGADVVVLDVVEFVADQDKPAARDHVQAAIVPAQSGGAEVFVQVDAALLYADLHACVWPGLCGVVISRLESPAQVEEAETLLSQLEARRGLLPGSVEIVAALETASGNHAAYEMSNASQRIRSLTLGRADLIMDLRPEPSGDIHLLPYLMQRLIAIAYATGAVPIGAWWRAPARGLLATPEQTYEAALRGRAIGFKGAFCVQAGQVDALNRAFTPSDAEQAQARQLLSTYQASLAQGSAVAVQEDRLLARATATQAQTLLALAAACTARDQSKSAAVARAPLPQ
jgi:citrate lyase subunit beta/citryl-CoA lyase